MRAECTAQPESAPVRVLVVDDHAENLKLLRQALEQSGYWISGTTRGSAALKIAADRRPDLILLDVLMPEMDGFETCQRLKEDRLTREIPVIFITGKNEPASVVRGFQVGGVDYITRPFVVEEVLARVRTHLELHRSRQDLKRKNEELQAEIARRQEAEAARQRADEKLDLLAARETEQWGIEGFVGRSRTIGRILEETRQLQMAVTSVLITGESGTGKELIARAIHFGGSRSRGPFIPVNGSAIPTGLAESALFGHRRGAFTGATADRQGYFALASGGTLFLDEIGEMPRQMQAKLLRVLEEGRILPVGGTEEVEVDVRVLAATNVDLTERIASGDFRQDLYFRLARFTVQVPPLRERPEDIPLLTAHFLGVFAREMGIAPPALSAAALRALEGYVFPGNVRELKNMIEHALIKSKGRTILPQHLPFLDLAGPEPAPPPHSWPGTRQPMRPPTEEEQVIAYLRQHAYITNAQCRDLLGVGRNRAFYLLDKMRTTGQLVQEGVRRGARYRLA